MYYAKERRSGHIVHADKASQWGDYRCPTCNVEVFLRSGDYRAAHFAHKAGQGKPECDEFHPSYSLGYSWTTPESYQGPPVDPLLLSIELEPDYDARRGPRKWGLRLTVAKSPDDHGTVQIDCGGGDIRKIVLSKLVLGAQTYPADLSAPDFGANWVSPDVRPPYKEALEHRIPGLSKRVANVFVAAGRAKQKTQIDVLRWGDSYYFVWSGEQQITFPAAISVHALADNYGWRCSLIGLPDKADPEIEAWLTETCDLPLVRARREWAFLYPPAYAVDDDGTLQVPSASQLFIAIQPVDDQAENDSVVNCDAGSHSASATLKGLRRHLFEISVSDQTARSLVLLRWDETYLATVRAKPYSDTTAEPVVALRFDGEESASGVALHRAACRELLEEVRRGRRRILEISGHPLLTGRFRWQPANAFDWQILGIAFQSVTTAGTAVVDGQSLQRIEEILRDRSAEVELDFGPYGSFHSAPCAPNVTTIDEFSLGRGLRARIEWLCKSSGAYAAPRGPLEALDDSALLRFFSELAVPVALLGHRRAIEHELRMGAKAVRS